MANQDRTELNPRPADELSDLELEKAAGGLCRKEVMQTPGPGGTWCSGQHDDSDLILAPGGKGFSCDIKMSKSSDSFTHVEPF